MKTHKWIVNADNKLISCKDCGYQIVATQDDEIRGGSKHEPLRKTIFTDKTSITISDAEHLVRVWGIVCTNQI